MALPTSLYRISQAVRHLHASLRDRITWQALAALASNLNKSLRLWRRDLPNAVVYGELCMRE